MADAGDATHAAWQAYRAMLASKDAHFRALEALNGKRELGEQVTLAETAYLEQLLAAHTSAVAGFRSAMAALAGDARTDFVRLLGEVNEGLGAGALPGAPLG